MLICYRGPHRPGVDVERLDPNVPDAVRSYGLAEYGEPIDLPDAVAKGLLEQGPDHWQPVKSKPKKEN